MSIRRRDGTMSAAKRDLFWTTVAGVHECWRRALDVNAYGYQKVGQYCRDRKTGVYSAVKNPLPSGMPITKDFDDERDARSWIES